MAMLNYQMSLPLMFSRVSPLRPVCTKLPVKSLWSPPLSPADQQPELGCSRPASASSHVKPAKSKRNPIGRSSFMQTTYSFSAQCYTPLRPVCSFNEPQQKWSCPTVQPPQTHVPFFTFGNPTVKSHSIVHVFIQKKKTFPIANTCKHLELDHTQTIRPSSFQCSLIRPAAVPKGSPRSSRAA